MRHQKVVEGSEAIAAGAAGVPRSQRRIAGDVELVVRRQVPPSLFERVHYHANTSARMMAHLQRDNRVHAVERVSRDQDVGKRARAELAGLEAALDCHEGGEDGRRSLFPLRAGADLVLAAKRSIIVIVAIRALLGDALVIGRRQAAHECPATM